jgi:formylglycine-generating enzyme required for sulfatase activity
MGKNPSYFKDCFDCPVENVTWHDANKYCEKIGKRLPREEEWEYAYRAGSMAKYPWGDNLDGKYAWYHENADFKTHPVENKSPNAWGLYDMSGNVWEWCADPWRPYSAKGKADPDGPRSSPSRIIRGGAWDKSEYVLRCSARGRYGPGERSNNIGFRCAR